LIQLFQPHDFKSTAKTVAKLFSLKLLFIKSLELFDMSFIMSVASEFEAANQKYAASFTKGDLALPPAR